MKDIDVSRRRKHVIGEQGLSTDTCILYRTGCLRWAHGLTWPCMVLTLGSTPWIFLSIADPSSRTHTKRSAGFSGLETAPTCARNTRQGRPPRAGTRVFLASVCFPFRIRQRKLELLDGSWDCDMKYLSRDLGWYRKRHSLRKRSGNTS